MLKRLFVLIFLGRGFVAVVREGTGGAAAVGSAIFLSSQCTEKADAGEYNHRRHDYYLHCLAHDFETFFAARATAAGVASAGQSLNGNRIEHPPA